MQCNNLNRLEMDNSWTLPHSNLNFKFSPVTNVTSQARSPAHTSHAGHELSSPAQAEAPSLSQCQWHCRRRKWYWALAAGSWVSLSGLPAFGRGSVALPGGSSSKPPVIAQLPASVGRGQPPDTYGPARARAWRPGYVLVRIRHSNSPGLSVQANSPSDSDSLAGWVWLVPVTHIIYCLFLNLHSWNSIAYWLIRWRVAG